MEAEPEYEEDVPAEESKEEEEEIKVEEEHTEL